MYLFTSMRRGNRPISILYRLLPALLLGLLLGACAAKNEGLAVRPEYQAAQGLSLPAPSGLFKHASYSDASRQQLGGNFNDLIPHNRVFKVGTTAVFTPYWFNSKDDTIEDSAYCFYYFDLSGYSGDPTLYLGWEEYGDPDTSRYYVALTNFEHDRWDWFPAPANWTLSFSDLATYRNEDGMLGAVVLVLGGGSYALDTMRVGPPVTEKLPPVAVLQADKINGVPPIDINFNAAASYDPDGMITLYELDLTGDGSYELSQDTPFDLDQTYSTNNSDTVRLRVTDNDGLTATDSVMLAISAGSGWVSEDVVNADRYSAPIWNVNGLPAVVTRRDLNLGFLRAMNKYGEWWSPTIDIKYTAWIEQYCAAMINGYPAAVYRTGFPTDAHDLVYISAKDALGDEWNKAHTVDSCEAMSFADFPKLFELNGRPAVLAVMQKDGVQEARLYLATDASGASWNPGVAISDKQASAVSGVCFAEGRPAVAILYSDGVQNHYAWVRATSADGSSWGAPVDIHTMAPGEASQGFNLGDARGHPALVYGCSTQALGGQSIYFKRAGDAWGASWPTSAQTVYTTSASSYVLWPRISTIANCPALAFEEWAPDDFSRILYTRALAADGSAWEDVSEVIRDDTWWKKEGPYRFFDLGMSAGMPAVISVNADFGAVHLSTRR
jgi:hypothetical protein